MSSDFSQFSSQNTQHSLHDGTAVDLEDNQSTGKAFFDNVYRILKVGSIYDIEHNQTQIAIAEFLEFFTAAMANSIEDSFSIIIRDELAIVNGTTLRLDRNAQKRHNELRDLFTAAKIRGLGLLHDMSAHDFTTFLIELKNAERSGQGMEHVDIPTIEISHGEPIRSILEALKSVNKSMYVAHVYIRGLVKVKNMHQQVRDRQDSDVPMGVIKRILQTVSEMLADDDFTILGLLPMKLVPGDLSSHSFNTAIYSMLLADRLGLPAQTTTYVGMAALYQDLDRLVGVAVGHRDRESILDTSHQFNSNLRDVAKMLGRVEGDVISTLRILLTYERGCTFDGKIARPFYRKGRDLHLVTRILDLCRVYDLLMQGLEGYKARRPDLAIQYIESRAGEAFDEELVELFVSTMGIYPIGTTVELTTGERGIVIRTPSPASDPRRPVVKLLQNDVVIDLSDGRYDHLEISRSVKTQEQDFASSRLFLLT